MSFPCLEHSNSTLPICQSIESPDFQEALKASYRKFISRLLFRDFEQLPLVNAVSLPRLSLLENMVEHKVIEWGRCSDLCICCRAGSLGNPHGDTV